ncbi:hypothetical protein B0T19DRAFT_443615 [Cercophora scortea]|uniref:Transglutaminase-like domain-containing protein n=1 Tax=Cercophora scortea TaxID=314031 RepID=A0AAE0MAR4_9PEZI|nr:hypothetical protein B0T19DRAFT_443615 [Cercophora scortea]
MAEVEEPQFSTLAERIAALNQQKNFKAPPPSGNVGKRPPPPPPVRAATPSAVVQPPPQHVSFEKSPSIPPRPVRAATERIPPPLPRRDTNNQEPPTPGSGPGRALAPPPLPTRNSQQQISPSLPSRRPSSQLPPPVLPSGRRNSNSSDISYLSTISTLSLGQSSSHTSLGQDQPLRRLPPTLDQANLPPLPPTRRELEAKAKEAAAQEALRSPSLPPRSASTSTVPRITDPQRPSLPPRLPSRPAKSPSTPQVEEQSPALPARRLPPQPSASQPKSALQNGFGGGGHGAAPPPIPLSSRPSVAQIQAVSTRSIPSAASPPPLNQCLVCRDFSGPDTAAAQYPLQSLPRRDPVGYLAHVLCDPFPSATDKARAIFTWCHHNIEYDVHGFLNKCIKTGQSIDEMIFSGKAVCEGYAKIYEAVAVRAGLQCIVVGGHGKGYGFHPLAAGQRPPPRDPSGHAWNAVRIDGGEWKIIDACWGAGALGDNVYHKRFAPEMFYLSNELIGLKHFPADSQHFFRSDGRIPTWEEYIVGPSKGEPASWFSDGTNEGLSEYTFEPKAKKIPVASGETVRFLFSKVCEHWDPQKHGRGKAMLLVLSIHGRGGGKDDLVTMETDGYWLWADVEARDLGAPGQTITLFGIDTVNGESARGMTKEQWAMKKGRCGYSMVAVAGWELV